MIRIVSFLGLFLLFISSFQCNESSNTPTTGTLDIVIKGIYDGQVWIADEVYPYYGDVSLSISRSEFFMTDIKISGSDGSKLISEVEYVNLQNQNDTEERAKEGVRYRYTKVPVGKYSQFEFGVGLNAEQNKKMPETSPNGSPFANPDLYWLGWDSYIFSKLEGHFSNAVYKNEPLIIHTGADGYLRKAVFTKPFSIKEEETTVIELYLDHKLIFGTASDYIDFATDRNVQAPSPAMIRYVDFYIKAFTLK